MFVNIIREMVNFEFGKVIEKVVFSCETSHQTSLVVEYLWLSDRALELGNPKVRGSISIQFLVGTQNFFFVPRSWQDEKTSLIISLLRSQTKLVGTLHQSNVFEVLSPSPTFKCCWLPTFLCHLAEPTHCYSSQMTKSRLHLRFRPLSARRWFAPRNSSRSAFFSAILYYLRSLSKTI